MIDDEPEDETVEETPPTMEEIAQAYRAAWARDVQRQTRKRLAEDMRRVFLTMDVLTTNDNEEDTDGPILPSR